MAIVFQIDITKQISNGNTKKTMIAVSTAALVSI